MKKIAWPIMLVLLTACATSSRGYIPEPKDAARTAQVTFMRSKNFYSGGLNAKVTLDGYRVATVGPGHYITFPVDPGTHSLGITESSVSVKLTPSEQYYFMVSVAPGGGFEIERIDEATATATMADYTAIP